MQSPRQIFLRSSPLAVILDASASTDADGTVTSYTFTFGDGATLTSPTPVVAHTYAAVGSFRACVTVTDSNGVRSATAACVTVSALANKPPVANFDGVVVSGAPRTLRFTDKSTDVDGGVVAWSWSFGDGTTSAERHPTHTYAAARSFSVTLVVTDAEGATARITKTYSVK